MGSSCCSLHFSWLISRQVNGGYDAVQEALLQITDRLKLHFFRDVFPSIDHPPNPAPFDSVPPLPSFMRRRELSPPSRMYPSFGPSAHKFDPIGGPGRFHTPDDHPPFVRDIFRSGLPPHMPERRPWGPEVWYLHDNNRGMFL